VRTAVVIASPPEFTLASVICRDDHTGWSDVEVSDGYGVVFVRRGRFRRRVDGVVTDLDRTLAYLRAPGQEASFAHPAFGGDECISLTLTPAAWCDLLGDRTVPESTVYVDARLELAYRRIGAAVRGGDVDYALAEELVRLLAIVLRPATPSSGQRHLVATAREAIDADHPAARGLLPLAELLGVSPFRLSRAFPRDLGVSLTRYRNRVRVGRAIDRIEQGERDLAALAADLGFADQAHLCRTVRDHLGETPTALRRLLAQPKR